MEYYLYILQSEKRETYYIGISKDPWRRIEYHNHTKKKGFTKRYRPWKLVFTESLGSKEKALIAEKKVKNWKSKKMIRLLLRNKINIHDYL